MRYIDAISLRSPSTAFDVEVCSLASMVFGRLWSALDRVAPPSVCISVAVYPVQG